jgi:hypothetical protein
MTDATGGPAPPEEDKRRIIEDAILAFRPEVKRDFPRDPSAEPELALAALAAAVTVRRLTKHRRLIDGFRRSTPGDRADLDDVARSVLDSTLEPGVPEERRPALVERAKRRLDEVAAAPGEPQLEQQHWDLWVRGTNDIFRFTTAERTFAAACNDNKREWRQAPDGEPVLSRIIVAQFYSDLPHTAFRPYVQPENWPGCCKFWESVAGLPVPTTAHAMTTNGYDWDFAETVNIYTNQLTVPLHIGFRELPDQVWTRFNLSQAYYTAATPVDVDTGTVSAASVSNGPAPTLVKATKWVHWRYPDQQPDLTAQACDCGWSELMEEMAYGCVQGFPLARVMLAGTSADDAETPADAIKQFVGAVTTECQQAIVESGPHLEQLMGRFTGRSWDAGWVNDLLDVGLVAANHYGNIASDIRRFADSLRDTLARSNTPTEGEGHG